MNYSLRLVYIKSRGVTYIINNYYPQTDDPLTQIALLIQIDLLIQILKLPSPLKVSDLTQIPQH